MEPIISYLDALSIEKVYFIALSVCLIFSFKIKKVFHLALITLAFNAGSQLVLFDYLFNKGVEAWVVGFVFLAEAEACPGEACVGFPNNSSCDMTRSRLLTFRAESERSEMTRIK